MKLIIIIAILALAGCSKNKEDVCKPCQKHETRWTGGEVTYDRVSEVPCGSEVGTKTKNGIDGNKPVLIVVRITCP